jgi:hypothetical protein
MLTCGSLDEGETQKFSLRQVSRGSSSAIKVTDNGFCAQVLLPRAVSHHPYINTQL